MATKPRVLVLGGLGFIGKNFVKYLVDNNLASKIRVVDKMMVAMARLGKDEVLFSSPPVECIQANLCNPDAVSKAFADSEDFQIVVNLAAETKLSQQEGVYTEGITTLSINVGQECLKHTKIQKFIEVSTAEVYEPSNKPCSESSNIKPWTGIAKAKANAEDKLKKLAKLPLVIVRPAIVYGPGDTKGLAPRLCIAAVYKKTGQTMEYPQWFEQQKISTVHVSDVCRALWHVAMNADVGSVYNLADKGNLDQKKLNIDLEKIFGIKTGHLNLLTSEAVKLMDTDNLVSEINGEHAPIWAKMIGEAKLNYSPLTPWLDNEALTNCNLYVDGSAIEKTSFSYSVPNVTEEMLRSQLKHAVEMGWFPPNLF